MPRSRARLKWDYILRPALPSTSLVVAPALLLGSFVWNPLLWPGIALTVIALCYSGKAILRAIEQSE